eukprot:1136787-Pelagomonas_calceolata.AAC.7
MQPHAAEGQETFLTWAVPSGPTLSWHVWWESVTRSWELGISSAGRGGTPEEVAAIAHEEFVHSLGRGEQGQGCPQTEDEDLRAPQIK